MTVPKRRWLRAASVALSVAVCLFGGVGLLLLLSIYDGSYDPVRDDGHSVENVPFIVGRCVGAIVASVPAAIYLWRVWRESG